MEHCKSEHASKDCGVLRHNVLYLSPAGHQKQGELALLPNNRTIRMRASSTRREGNRQKASASRWQKRLHASKYGCKASPKSSVSSHAKCQPKPQPSRPSGATLPSTLVVVIDQRRTALCTRSGITNALTYVAMRNYRTHLAHSGSQQRPTRSCSCRGSSRSQEVRHLGCI